MLGRETEPLVGRTIDFGPQLGPRLTRSVGVAVAVGLVGWLAAYVFGLCPWFGYETWSARSAHVGPNDFLIGRDRSGGRGGFGLGTLPFLKGQTIVFSYEAEIRRGCLWLQVWHLWAPGPNASVSTCIDRSGKGEWIVPVTETGLYVLMIDESVVKGTRPGFDLDYTVWWGARW